MSEVTNLSAEIQKQLPAELVEFMRLAGGAAQGWGWKLYLVGGVVRDLLLERANLDLDLVVEGDAIDLAQELARTVRGKIATHRRFGTAKIQWNGWSADLATARRETYDRPGALPTVEAGSIRTDLFRRDFTINAMAVALNPVGYGELLDLYHGRDDLEHRLIRVLHEKSFVDDATRIWRGLRYEQRLDFQLEPVTLRLLKRDIAMLDTISGDRLRHDLEMVLKEELPEKALRRADELGVLARLHPALKGNGWLAQKVKSARHLSGAERPPVGLYMALMIYRLTGEEIEQLVSCLRLTRTMARTLRDTLSLRTKLGSLDDPAITPGRIYSLLHGYGATVITANLLAADSPLVRKHIQLFLDKLRYVRPALTGNDLKDMGITGPRIKEILDLLREARLDGRVSSKQGEEDLVRGWLAQGRV